MNKAHNNNLYGIFFMLLNSMAMALLYAIMKYMTKTLSSSQVVFFYKFGLFLCILPWVFKDGFKSIITTKFKLHILRGALSITAALFMMAAIANCNLVDATAIGYMEQVLLVIVGILYLKELATSSKIIGVIASFFGVLIVIYPEIIQFDGNIVPVLFQKKDFDSFNHYYIYAIIATALWAANSLVVKELGKTEKTKTQLFYVLFFSSLISYPVAFIKWGWLEAAGLHFPAPSEYISFFDVGFKLYHFKYIVVLALCYFFHSFAVFRSYRSGEISTIAPFYYSKLVFIGALGYYWFGETPAANELYIGYGLIISAGVILIRSEARRRKKEIAKQQLERLEEELGHV
jgi:drug/metabolite transporter (DMT)-like permease